MTNDTMTFTLRRHLLGAFLTRLKKLELGRALFGFHYFLTDPWPGDPVMAWSLAAYGDDDDEEPSFIDSVPGIRVAGCGDDSERVGVLAYRYGLLDALRALWERNTSSAELLDLTVRVRRDLEKNTLEPVGLDPNTTLRSPA